MDVWNIMAGIIFGSIGLGAFIYGKKQSHFRALAIGIILMAYPCFIQNTLALYAIGITLTGILFIFRD